MYHIGMTESSPGRRLRDAVEAERPLQVAGTINAYSALLAEKSGFRVIYLSGAGVANASGSGMGAMGTVGASANDQIHKRAVPMPPAFDPFGGMGPRKGEDEEDTVHKAADYLRERDDIYGVGSYTLPVIGESTTD